MAELIYVQLEYDIIDVKNKIQKIIEKGNEY